MPLVLAADIGEFMRIFWSTRDFFYYIYGNLKTREVGSRVWLALFTGEDVYPVCCAFLVCCVA